MLELLHIGNTLIVQHKYKKTLLDTTENIEHVLSKLYKPKIFQSHESAYLLGLNTSHELEKIFYLATGDAKKVLIDGEDLLFTIFSSDCDKYILSHNHTKKETCGPSLMDIKSTREISNVMKKYGKELHDHIIWTKKKSYSFRMKKFFKQKSLTT